MSAPPPGGKKPRRGPGPLLWVGIGGGAAVVAGALAVTLVLVLGRQEPRPDAALGWFDADL